MNTYAPQHRQPRFPFLPVLLALGAVLALLMLLVPATRNPPRVAALLAQRPPSTLPVPVAGVRPAHLSNTWGAARSGGRRHEGIDIFARRNTPIRSTTEGVVVSTSPNALGGECIVVMGPGGHRHYYAHLERHGRYDEGDWVNTGDTIGYVGNSGNARTTPPHLHYGIYTASGAINPYPFLAKSSRSGVIRKASLKKKAKPKRAVKKKKASKKKSRDGTTRSR
jgi:murein DD-endopeptidase MepM/ murein hydrolase activator NlpD